MFNFNHLYNFYIFVKAGNSNAALKQLNISQPSLSNHLKILEESLATKLFLKTGETDLTERGELVYNFCCRIFDSVEEMKEIIPNYQFSGSRSINIGVHHEIDRSFASVAVKPLLKKYKIQSPPIVKLIAGNEKELVEELRLQKLHALITDNPIREPDLVNIAQIKSPVALICSARTKKTSTILSEKQNTLSIKELKELIKKNETSWVMPSAKSKLRKDFGVFLGHNRIDSEVLLESNDVSALIRSVIDDVGYTFMPVAFVASEIKNGLLHAFGPKNGFWKHAIWLTCHIQNQNDALIQSLASSFKEVGRIFK